VTTQTHDDAFHEIQLNGKQLVFLFMAATVVSVVIFLCGVLVGRGVRTDRGIVAEATAPPALAGHPPPTESSDDTREAPPPAELSYVKRLEDAQPSSEELKPAPTGLVAAQPPAVEQLVARAVPTPAAPPPKPAPSAAAPEAKTKVVPAPPPAAKPPVVVDQNPALTAKASVARPPAVAPAPAGDWTVQVAAVNDRGEADVMVKRLSTKGYSAFVVAPASGTPAIFRVRVGAFKTKREAESLAVKIQKEERYKSWVTR
jgi:cell division septation protein DedD